MEEIHLGLEAGAGWRWSSAIGVLAAFGLLLLAVCAAPRADRGARAGDGTGLAAAGVVKSAGYASKEAAGTPLAISYFPLVSWSLPTPTATRTPSPTGGPACAALSDSREVALAIVRIVNQERAARGIAPVQVDEDLMSQSQWKALDFIARHYFAHVSPPPDSEDCYQRSLRLHLTLCMGENIAWQQPDCAQDGWALAQDVARLWMSSDSHQGNLLNPSWRLMGAGLSYEPETQRLYSVAQFGL